MLNRWSFLFHTCSWQNLKWLETNTFVYIDDIIMHIFSFKEMHTWFVLELHVLCLSDAEENPSMAGKLQSEHYARPLVFA